MGNYGKTIRRELRQCASTMTSDCGLTAKDIENRIGNPAGTKKPDVVNPIYRGKVFLNGEKLIIKLKVKLTGHESRAKAAVKNIVKVYATQKVIVEFSLVSKDYDLRIHGATLGELAVGVKSCSCEAMLNIGGWGPSYKHHKWGDTLLVNPYSLREYWKNTDAHEFGHKLGLQHRTNLGLMDYWNETKYPRRDPRKFLSSERDRIIKLYL